MTPEDCVLIAVRYWATDVPGLVVTPNVGAEGYVVTHRQSGALVSPREWCGRAVEDARQYAHALAGPDWTATWERMSEDKAPYWAARRRADQEGL